MVTVNLTPPRAVVQGLMTDRVRFTRGEPTKVLNKATGALTVTPAPTVYEGPCFVTVIRSNAFVKSAEAGTLIGFPGGIVGHRIKIPFHDSPEIKLGDHAEIIASQDPQLVGATAVVEDIAHSTLQVWRDISVSGLETARG